MSLGDIYYILFRRKWVILVFSLLGFIAAGAFYFLFPPSYQSFAAVWIGYEVDSPPPDMAGLDARPVMQDRGATILNSEIQLLQSFDLAKKVAETIGPATILGDNKAGTNTADVDRAAILIERHFVIGDPTKTTQTAPNSSVIQLAFSHPNPGIVQRVLDLMITNYVVKHSDIHHRPGVYDAYWNDQYSDASSLLTTTEKELVSTKSPEGIVDLPEALKAFHTREAAAQQEQFKTLSDLAEALAREKELRSSIPPDRGPAAPTNPTLEAPAPPAAPEVTPPTAAEQEAYNEARQSLMELQTIESKLESMYTTNNSQVKTNLLAIEAAKARKQELEKASPGLVMVPAGSPAAAFKMPAAPPAPAALAGLDPMVAYSNEVVRIAGLRARLAFETNELAEIKKTGTNLVQLEVNIGRLERDEAMEVQKLNHIKQTMQSAAIASDLGPGKVSNISIAEQPTPPAPNLKQIYKIVAGLAAGGVALGLGLAFVLEMVLDRSFKRPKEVVSTLGLPFFLSVPYLNGHAKLRLPKPGKEVGLLPAGTGASNGGGPEAARPGLALPGGGSEGVALAPARQEPVAPGDENQVWRPFHETLRDRLIAYFEMLNLTHKPKLVALTSCDHGAGVSTMASGLASLLSETGDGNVLLVNMNSEEGDAHQFYKGKPNLGLDDLFEKEAGTRSEALVQENLYVIKESSNRDKLPAILPKRFSHLVTKMKASDYDYIIFDMPPVTQISVTPRLARFMDMVLLVVESEKTDRDVAQRAASLLTESRANVGVVMNKNRTYVPRRLHQEL